MSSTSAAQTESPFLISPTQRLRVSLLLALGLFQGAVYHILPLSFVQLERAFGLNVEELARIPAAFFLSTIGFSAGGGAFFLRLGLRRGTIMSLLGVAGGLFLISVSPAFLTVILGAIVFGLTIAAVEVAASAVISENFGGRRQTLFFAWGIANAMGSTAGPIALGFALELGPQWGIDWRLCFFAAASVAVVFAGLWLLLDPGVGSIAPTEPKVKAVAEAGWVLRQPAIYAVSLLILLHGVSQIGMISWIGQLPINREVSSSSAAHFITVNSIGYFLGRAFLTALTARRNIPELAVLAIANVGAAIFFAATIFVPSYPVALGLFLVAGIFVSANGPAVNSLVGRLFVRHSATAFSVMNGAANLGAAAGPYLVGALGAGLGVAVGIRILPLFSLTLGCVAAAWFVRSRLRVSGPR